MNSTSDGRQRQSSCLPARAFQIRNPIPARRDEIRNTSSGFTLIELLIVVSILLVLTTMIVLTFNANSGTDKMRSAGRNAQSSFLGARDRALHFKQRIGIRMQRDPQDSTLVYGFVYIQPIPTLKYGYPTTTGPYVAVCRPDDAPSDNDHMGVDAYSSDVNYLSSNTKFLMLSSTDWYDLDAQGLLPIGTRVRVPNDPTGAWYQLVQQAASPPYYAVKQTISFTNQQMLAPGGTSITVSLLTLVPPGVLPTLAHPFPEVQMIQSTESDASCELELGNELLPQHQPLPLPSGVVVDLDWSGRNDFVPPTLAGANTAMGIWPATPSPTNIDILFSQRGTVTGPLSGLGPIYLLLNDIRDATLNLNPIDPLNKGDKKVVAIFPQTGNIQVFPIDPTDLYNNVTGAAGADGYADDLFRFAKRGSVAGQ